MSAVVLVDSDVMIGSLLENDEHHNKAKPIFRGIDRGTLPKAIITEYVLMETMNFLTKKSSPDKCEEVLNRLEKSENYRIYRIPNVCFQQGKGEIFTGYNALSLADSISVSFMKNRNIDYIYSFDDDFDEVGTISRLNSAVSPY